MEQNSENAIFGSTIFYGAETWTLRKVDQKYVTNFEMEKDG